jgi:hypothetical protein
VLLAEHVVLGKSPLTGMYACWAVATETLVMRAYSFMIKFQLAGELPHAKSSILYTPKIVGLWSAWLFSPAHHRTTKPALGIIASHYRGWFVRPYKTAALHHTWVDFGAGKCQPSSAVNLLGSETRGKSLFEVRSAFNFTTEFFC